MFPAATSLATARLVCAAALILWAIALALVAVIDQAVTYTVCSRSLLNFSLPSIHWPPEGQNLELLTIQHDVTLAAVGIGIIGAFAMLYALPSLNTLYRTVILIGAVATSFVAAGILWLAVEHHTLSAQLTALAHCL